jgi:uncharacterized protein (DUF427 family)
MPIESGSGSKGRECVWEYPRPPRLERTSKHIRVEFAGVVLADTRSAFRVLETSHPPVYYVPPQHVTLQHLIAGPGGSYCEWKGRAAYYTVVVGSARVEDAAWYYPEPTPAFEAIRDHVAFYAACMGGCFVDGERVEPQPGDFYGGWITSDLVGPFKVGRARAIGGRCSSPAPRCGRAPSGRRQSRSGALDRVRC